MKSVKVKCVGCNRQAVVNAVARQGLPAPMLHGDTFELSYHVGHVSEAEEPNASKRAELQALVDAEALAPLKAVLEPLGVKFD